MTDFTPDSPTIQIPLGKGLSAIISAIDIDLVYVKYKWGVQWKKKFPKLRYPVYVGAQNKSFYLHRLIAERIAERPLTSKDTVDHINGDTLDNRRENLRLVTPSQNTMNRGKPNTNTSGYKGVSKSAPNTWRAYISFDKKRIHLGSFKTKEDAARAYNQAVPKYHGEFGRLNEID